MSVYFSPLPRGVRFFPRAKSLVRGFTLIELLVVIAIISLLAAILFPVFARARESARKTSCNSNVKMLATATLMYAQDYDGLHIGFFTGSDRKVILFPYVRQGRNNNDLNNDVWRCPSAMGWNFASYGFNSRMNAVAQPDIAKPAETVMLCDAGLNDDGTGRVATHVMPPSTLTNTSLCRPNPRHFEGCSVGFMDGHAKWMKLDTPFYPPGVALNGVAATWTGNGITDPADPNYKDQMWDLL